MALKENDTKGTLHAKMGTIKDRNSMDLTEAEDIKKRRQEYTELYKKALHDPDNQDRVITHLKPDILECEVKWALGSITRNKASGKIEGRRRTGWKRMRCLGSVTDSMNMSLSNLQEMVKEDKASLACYSPRGLKESDTTEWLNNNKTNIINVQKMIMIPIDAQYVRSGK